MYTLDIVFQGTAKGSYKDIHKWHFHNVPLDDAISVLDGKMPKLDGMVWDDHKPEDVECIELRRIEH